MVTGEKNERTTAWLYLSLIGRGGRSRTVTTTNALPATSPPPPPPSPTATATEEATGIDNFVSNHNSLADDPFNII